VRQAWPDAVEAAVALGELDLADDLIGRIAVRPPGRFPPLLRAELPRARGLLATARGEHDRVERELSAAIEGLLALDYPYWIARARTDLAAWLIHRNRTAEASACSMTASRLLRPSTRLLRSPAPVH
jgi:hypothetical protein